MLVKSALAAAVIALALAAYAVLAGIGQQHTISQLRAELAQARTVQARTAQIITAQQAKLAGEHRDLITCADLQHLTALGTDSNGDQMAIGDFPATSPYGGNNNQWMLPAHCING